MLLAVGPAFGQQEFPAHVGKVNDFATVLSDAQRDQLEADLAALERSTSAEVAVVTVATTGERGIEEYATALFNSWGIGKKDRDNGVLILVSPNDRAMRIEVGYGLEPVLPDGLAGAVIRETFLPRFRAGDLAGGIVDGTARVVGIVQRNETLTPEQRRAYELAAIEAGKSWGLTAFLGIFVAIGAFTAGTAAGAKIAIQLVFGLFFTGGALWLSSFEAPRYGVAVLVVFAAVVLVLSARLAQRPSWRRKLRGTQDANRSGWIAADSSPSSSSGSSGGSSSGGSFGGGSSGGGGASGRW